MATISQYLWQDKGECKNVHVTKIIFKKKKQEKNMV